MSDQQKRSREQITDQDEVGEVKKQRQNLDESERTEPPIENDEQQQYELEEERGFEHPVPTDTWFGTFYFVGRELGNNVATVDRCFLSLAKQCLRVSCPVLLGDNEPLLRPLRIKLEDNESENHHHPLPYIYNLTTSEELALPKGRAPNNIVGFSRIEINYFDDKVLAFLTLIRPILNQLHIHFVSYGWNGLDFYHNGLVALDHLLKICGFANIRALTTELRLLACIEAKYPAMLAQLRFLSLKCFLYGAAWEEEGPDLVNIFIKWLSTARTDGMPKMSMLSLGSNPQQFFAEQFKKAFLNATTASASIVRIDDVSCYGIPRLLGNLGNLRNLTTGEQLSVQIEDKIGYKSAVIKRHRNGQLIDNDNWRQLDNFDWEAFAERQTLYFVLGD